MTNECVLYSDEAHFTVQYARSCILSRDTPGISPISEWQLLAATWSHH